MMQQSQLLATESAAYSTTSPRRGTSQAVEVRHGATRQSVRTSPSRCYGQAGTTVARVQGAAGEPMIFSSIGGSHFGQVEAPRAAGVLAERFSL